jgi:hypothetical protein
MPDPHAFVFWPEFKAAGFLDAATVTSGGVTVDVDVAYERPDTLRFDNQTRSTEHLIEYQHHDLPDLAEGDELVIENIGSFKVRSVPFVSDNPEHGIDGFFRRAILTKLS